MQLCVVVSKSGRMYVGEVEEISPLLGDLIGQSAKIGHPCLAVSQRGGAMLAPPMMPLGHPLSEIHVEVAEICAVDEGAEELARVYEQQINAFRAEAAGIQLAKPGQIRS